jgi:ubiquinol-cytochrome c reductase cytochrome b subunit
MKPGLMVNKLLQWVDARFPLMSTWKRYFSAYYVPKNLNFFYFFGSLAIVVLLNQLVSGLWLTMFYTPTSEHAFSSVEYIMRDINYGWLLRYMHSTGASAFFIVIYVHLFRGLLYGSYQRPRELVWILGVFLYVFLLAEAFLGYLLPWGQMSYWGAQVVTSLLGSLPYLGNYLMEWLRGGYSVGNATLHRFFALHVIAVPFLIVFFSYLHLVALHKVGSNNPQGIEINPEERIPFHPYYLVKDLVGVVLFLILFFAVVFFAPEMGGYFLEPNNFTPANPLVTPDHIAPLWYMSPFYAILRAIPDKLVGIFCMVSAPLLFFILPWLDQSPVRSMRYKGKGSRVMLATGVSAFLLLGYLGMIPVNSQRLLMARMSTVFYFAYFLLMPWYTRWEKTKLLPLRIGSQ